MTKEQYEKYQQIEEEIKPVKDFLFWSGKRYRNSHVGHYRFCLKIFGRKFCLYIQNRFCTIPENTYYIPEELEDRIIETIENYVDEKEREMQEI